MHLPLSVHCFKAALALQKPHSVRDAPAQYGHEGSNMILLECFSHDSCHVRVEALTVGILSCGSDTCAETHVAQSAFEVSPHLEGDTPCIQHEGQHIAA